MGKPTFLFISLLLLSFPFLSGGLEISLESQFTVSLLFIFTIGIAHGSIDNILYLKKSSISPLKFYFAYLSLIGIFATIWFMIPVFTLLLFLVLSAYHFGQSQLVDCLSTNKIINKLLFFFWGIAILSSLIYFQNQEIKTALMSFGDMRVFAQAMDITTIKYCFGISTTLTFITLLYLTVTNSLKFTRFCFEVLILTLLNLSFAVLPVLFGFTLYFIFLHSLKVLEDEFTFLKPMGKVKIYDFIKQLLPNTLISIVGLIIIFAGIHFDILPLSYAFALLILISSITFPHAFVMEKFYTK